MTSWRLGKGRYEPQFSVHFGPFTLADYLAIVVLPSLAEFAEKPDDRRRAYVACIVIAHMTNHVAKVLLLQKSISRCNREPR